MTARRCVEMRETPEELIEDVIKLSPMFEATLKLFDREAAPPIVRRPVGFGRKAVGFGARV